MSLKKILSSLTKADLDYSLIDDGDIIAVGVSGGKDSMLLLKTLKQYQKYPFKRFDFYAVFLDLGFGNVDIETLKQYCLSIDVKLHIEDSTDVCKILLQHKSNNGNLPCSICSRMKKAAINKVAHLLNCNKVAFAHHLDDALETLLMNSIYGGRIATFAPKMFLSDTKLSFIRPFLLVREKEIISACKSENIPVIKSSCPNDHNTMREEAKNMLSQLYKMYPTSYSNYQKMLSDKEHFNIWIDKLEFPINKNTTIKECCSIGEFNDYQQTKKEVFIDEFNLSVDSIINKNINNDSHCYNIYHLSTPIGTICFNQIDNYFLIEDITLKKEFYIDELLEKIILYIESIISTKHNPCIIKVNHYSYNRVFEKLNYSYSNNETFKTITNAFKYKVQNIIDK